MCWQVKAFSIEAVDVAQTEKKTQTERSEKQKLKKKKKRYEKEPNKLY